MLLDHGEWPSWALGGLLSHVRDPPVPPLHGQGLRRSRRSLGLATGMGLGRNQLSRRRQPNGAPPGRGWNNRTGSAQAPAAGLYEEDDERPAPQLGREGCSVRALQLLQAAVRTV